MNSDDLIRLLCNDRRKGHRSVLNRQLKRNADVAMRIAMGIFLITVACWAIF